MHARLDPAQNSVGDPGRWCRSGRNAHGYRRTDTAGGTVASDGRQSWIRTNWGLLLAVGVLAVILLLPTPADLPVAGHRMLAILGFAVIVWMTEALDYAVSAVVIAALMAFLLGLSPEPGQSQGADGHERRRWRSPSAALPTPRWRWSPRRCFWPPP